MSVKVSVVIPVYDAEKYIQPCIESLLSQTMKACEFIFINDGSKDRSRAIIEAYRMFDPRIKLINQENQGVSAARNAGLNEAAGEYVGFVDADDYIEKDMFAILYHAARLSECDVVISNFESELEGYKVLTTYPFPHGKVLDRTYVEQEILPYFLKSDQLNTACNKIYRNDVLKVNGVKFPEKITLGEDGLFNMQFFRYAAHAVYIDYTGYHYREVAGSATRNIVEKDYFKRALEVYKLDLPDLIPDQIDKMKSKELRSIKLINSVMSYIYVYFKASRKVSFSQRLKYVNRMIHHPDVREALPLYYREIYSTLGRYDKFIADMIRRKSTMGLYCATAYSRLRNKQ